jgi:pyruvate, orthophosphate dikinase
VGCDELSIDPSERTCSIAGHVLHEGDVLCLDANTGAIYSGEMRVRRQRPTELIERLRQHVPG